MQLFKTDYVNPRIQKQIKKYTDEYHYTYSGIRKALYYHYEIRHGDLEKACGAIGML